MSIYTDDSILYTTDTSLETAVTLGICEEEITEIDDVRVPFMGQTVEIQGEDIRYDVVREGHSTISHILFVTMSF